MKLANGKQQLCTTCMTHTDDPCDTVSQAASCWMLAIYNSKKDDEYIN